MPILHFLMCPVLHLKRHVLVICWTMCHLVLRRGIRSFPLFSSSHLNYSWENTLEDTTRWFSSHTWGAVLVMFHHLLSGYFLSSPWFKVMTRFMSKTYMENKFSVSSSLASHYIEFWQTEFTDWAALSAAEMFHLTGVICCNWNEFRDSLEFIMPYQLL